MQTHLSSHLVFIDFENVQDIDLGLVEGKPVHVTLMIGKNQRQLSLTLVRQIHRQAAQVELVEVGASGHNALDLTLAFYLGQAVQLAPSAQSYIVSKDKDFDPMIAHLRARGVALSRHDSFAALPFLPQPKKKTVAAKNSLPDRRAKVLARLKNPTGGNGPSSRKALLAHIKTSLGKEATEAKIEDILNELIAGRYLTIDTDEKVSYAVTP